MTRRFERQLAVFAVQVLTKDLAAMIRDGVTAEQILFAMEANIEALHGTLGEMRHWLLTAQELPTSDLRH